MAEGFRARSRFGAWSVPKRHGTGDASGILEAVTKSRPTRCRNCGETLPPPKQAGRPREFCGGTCRKAYQRRPVPGAWSGVPGESFGAGAVVIVPESAGATVHQQETVGALASLLDDQAAGSPEDQAVRWLVEVGHLEMRARRLSRVLPPNLSWRYERAATSIAAMIRDLFPTTANGGPDA